MAGGMRFDGDDIRRMPLSMQEQLGSALVAQMAQSASVAGREERCVNKQSVRRLIFVNDRAARRYRILRKWAESGMICELLMHKDRQERICCFTYTVTEEY